MEEFIYLALNKPFGYVCSTCSDRRHTIYQLLSSDIPGNVHPVGRLDAETTGLIILTNDGMLNHNLTIPENHIPKTYKVRLEHSVTPQQQQFYTQMARSGLMLPEDKKAAPYFAQNAEINWPSAQNVSKNQNECFITISEGKFHQVRRTFTALENTVIALERIKIGKLELPPDLQPGQYFMLSKEQINYLYNATKEPPVCC